MKKTAPVLPLPSYRDLREHFDADADYERLWRARLLRNAKAMDVNGKLSRWHSESVRTDSNVVRLEMPCWLLRQAD